MTQSGKPSLKNLASNVLVYENPYKSEASTIGQGKTL